MGFPAIDFMTYEEAYEKAKELAIKEVKTKSNGDYVYIVVNIGKRDFGITHDWVEFMYERIFGYKIIETIIYEEQDNNGKARGKRREIIKDESI